VISLCCWEDSSRKEKTERFVPQCQHLKQTRWHLLPLIPLWVCVYHTNLDSVDVEQGHHAWMSMHKNKDQLVLFCISRILVNKAMWMSIWSHFFVSNLSRSVPSSPKEAAWVPMFLFAAFWLVTTSLYVLYPLFTGGPKIRVSEFLGTISCRGPGYEPCIFCFWGKHFPEQSTKLKNKHHHNGEPFAPTPLRCGFNELIQSDAWVAIRRGWPLVVMLGFVNSLKQLTSYGRSWPSTF
jgi:hypothetical protein